MDGTDDPEIDAEDEGSDPTRDRPTVHTENQGILSEPKTENGRNEVDKPKKRPNRTRPIEWLQFGVNLALVIIGITALIVYYAQLEQMAQATQTAILATWNAALQTKFTREAVLLGSDQFVADNRPWVAIDTGSDKGIVPYEDMQVGINATIPSDYVKFVLSYSLKNFGRTPAYVEINTEVRDINYPLHGKYLTNMVEQFCEDDYRNRVSLGKNGWPCTIVPGTMNYNRPEILPITEKMRKTGKMEPTVIGCIWYRSTNAGDNAIHKTPFSAQISMKTVAPENTAPVAITFPVDGSTIPAKKLKTMDVLVVGKAD